MQTRTSTIDIAAVQKELSAQGLDGWLFNCFHGNDPVGMHVLGLPASLHATRRWFYFIPARGEPRKLLHRIELNVLDTLPGSATVYLGWKELEQKLAELLSGVNKLAMQYSPNNAIPYISRVDAGTLELVRACGCEIVSSADLVQTFEARLSPQQHRTHVQAVEHLRQIVLEAFDETAKAVRHQGAADEYEIQQFIWRRFAELDMMSNSEPIVAVNQNSGKPHYQPSRQQSSAIKEGDFLLIDLWAKHKQPDDSIYGDITWTGFVGKTVPDKHRKIFDIVAGARDAAVAFIKDSVTQGRQIQGWMVDDVTRQYIAERGYGEYFIHRTGHSIGIEVHGNGANIDNLETQDRRTLIPQTCFSIEPGIYLPEFGVRSEIDVYLSDNGVHIAGEPIQTEVVPILA
jgi:Xaa-Pro aminopeptidase